MANAKRASSSPEEQEIIAGQNEIGRLPKEYGERVKLLDNEKTTRERMNDKLAQVKKDSGLPDLERNLTESWGYTPQALKIIRTLDGMPARSRAATIRQINLRAEDKSWILPDMFDQAAAASRPQQEPPAQQRTTEQMAESHAGAEETEVVLTSNEAKDALDEYLSGHPRKRGAKPAELIRLEKQYEAALAREGKPASNVVPISAQMREASKAGDEHIQKQIDETKGTDAAKASAKAAEPAAEKPKRGRGKKAEPAAETAPPASSGPPAMDEEDEDAEEAPPAPTPPGSIGTAPPTFRM